MSQLRISVEKACVDAMEFHEGGPDGDDYGGSFANDLSLLRKVKLAQC